MGTRKRTGRARLCLGAGSSVCLDGDRTRMGSRERFPAMSRPDHTRTGSSWCACPGSFPERDLCHASVPVPDWTESRRLSRYWSGTGSPVSLCSGTGRDKLCPCPTASRRSCTRPFSPQPPQLSMSGGDYPGGPESSAFGSIPPAGLSRGTPNPRIKRIGGFYMQSRRAGQWALSRECRGTRHTPGAICSRGVQDDPQGMFTQT